MTEDRENIMRESCGTEGRFGPSMQRPFSPTHANTQCVGMAVLRSDEAGLLLRIVMCYVMGTVILCAAVWRALT